MSKGKLTNKQAWRFIGETYLHIAADDPREYALPIGGLCLATSHLRERSKRISEEQEQEMDDEISAIMKAHDRHGWLCNTADEVESGVDEIVLRGTLALIFAEAAV